ncbi:hypothetical protein ARMSODRAFT_1024791 [Armillaria solidipes]|uniref:Uncharacterized protein n=1 Tax=Armillaria solidipes TaxID=1076256 RepID=A0A2H3BHQ2_9AGAR|nr:hypothetical protein ARMSODRAFT_1024791 [Armillaria solidipes]
MESTKPAAFYAPDVAPPPPLVVPLAATDIIVPWMLTAWALEPLPRDLKPLAKTLRRTKARFRPYPTEATRGRSGSPARGRSATPAPSPSSSPLPRIDKGKNKQTSTPPPPTPGPMDSGEEDGEDEEGGEDEEDGDEDEDGENGEELRNEHVLKQPSRATVERLLIPQPKGIGSLGLKQLGTELNWSDDSYERLVKHAEKIFPKHMRNDKRAQLHGKHSNARQMLREFADPLESYVDYWPLAQVAQRLCKKKAEKVRTNAVKRTVMAIQEAAASRPVPRTITVKKKKAVIIQEPPTESSPPRRSQEPTTGTFPPCRKVWNVDAHQYCYSHIVSSHKYEVMKARRHTHQ